MKWDKLLIYQNVETGKIFPLKLNGQSDARAKLLD